mgnify:CR=1 FL=1|tara:strand:+ start:28322 stop:28942 length:621 start_codon:yes stop_codon:yes gene_type:complete
MSTIWIWKWGESLIRKFAIIGHDVPAKGDFSLNDLAGGAGRLDVLLRAVNTALFVSHGIREDTQIILHLEGSGSRRIRFDSRSLRGVHPDERSIAGQVRAIVRSSMPPVGVWKEYSGGISHSGGSIGETLQEWSDDGCKIFVMDSEGRAVEDFSFEGELGFVLSDHKPFTKEEFGLMKDCEKVSVGQKWLQGHSCIAIVHHHLDSS